MSTIAEQYEQYSAAGRIWGQIPMDRISKIQFPRVPKVIIDQLVQLPDLTTTISDVLDSLGIRGAVAASHIGPLQPGHQVAGTVVTLRGIPERKTVTQGYADADPVRMSTRDIYYMSEPGDVLVADFGGDREVSNMGGQSALVAQTRGFAGSIVNGAIRDANTIRGANYPIWCSGITPKTGKFRLETIEINGPVTVHDIVANAGDLAVADDSGICIVPAQLVGEVVRLAAGIIAEENLMRDLIRGESPIPELRPLYRKRYSAASPETPHDRIIDTETGL